MKRLFKVWAVVYHKEWKGKWKPDYAVLGEGCYTYPLVAIISVLPDRWGRERLVSQNLKQMVEFVKYLNDMADEGEHYEIREVDPQEYAHLF